MQLAQLYIKVILSEIEMRTEQQVNEKCNGIASFGKSTLKKAGSLQSLMLEDRCEYWTLKQLSFI